MRDLQEAGARHARPLAVARGEHLRPSDETVACIETGSCRSLDSVRAMSQENIEIVIAGMEAINRRDVDAFLDCFAPDVEWVESGDVFPGLRGTHRGVAGVRRWFEEAILEPWDSLITRVEEYAEVGDDQVFAGFVATARGRTSGAETEIRFWSVFWFAERKIARRQVYWARAEALEGAGLPG